MPSSVRIRCGPYLARRDAEPLGSAINMMGSRAVPGNKRAIRAFRFLRLVNALLIVFVTLDECFGLAARSVWGENACSVDYNNIPYDFYVRILLM